MAKNGRFAKLKDLGYNLQGNALEAPQIQGEEFGVYNGEAAKAARDKWAADLPGEQWQAINDYSNEDYDYINSYLRYDEVEDDFPKWKLDLAIKRIDEGIETAPRYTGQVFRGVSAGVADTIGEAQEFFQDMLEAGGDIEFSGYGSSSADLNTAIRFMQTNAGKSPGRSEIPILYRINNSKTGRMIEAASGHAPEQEILFKHGSKFKMIDVSRAALDGGTGVGQVDYIIIELEEIVS